MAGGASWKGHGRRRGRRTRAAYGSHASSATRFEWHARSRLLVDRVAHSPAAVPATGEGQLARGPKARDRDALLDPFQFATTNS